MFSLAAPHPRPIRAPRLVAVTSQLCLLLLEGLLVAFGASLRGGAAVAIKPLQESMNEVPGANYLACASG